MQMRKKMKPVAKIVAKALVAVLTFGLMSGVPAKTARAMETETSIAYNTHCQKYGWLPYVRDGELSGTEGESKRLEAIHISVDSDLEGSVEYSVHCQTYGWMEYVSDGEAAGTSGESKRLESIKVRLTGELAEQYDVVYRVHRQTYGWTDWVKNDAECGTVGESKRLEAIQIKLVKKDKTPKASVTYRTHCQTHGWLPYVKDGEPSGTVGQGKRLEAINIDVDSNLTGGIRYSVHCQTYGWMNDKPNNMLAGTSGESKRLEAIKISLTGELAELYDVYYRVHSQTYGWLDWAKNGEISGTSGLSKRLESIEIRLVEKDGEAPGETAKPYISKEMVDAENKKPEDPENPEKPTVDFDATGQFAEDIEAVELHPMLTNDPYIDAQAEAILAEIITPEMTKAEMLWACHRWLMDNASRTAAGDDQEYTTRWANTSVNYESYEDLRIVTFSHPILIGKWKGKEKRYGGCINYASAFVVLARRLGFEAYRGAGYVRTSGNGRVEHYWTLVKAGDVYYNFDAEVPDTNHSLNPKNYFGKTKAEFEKLGFEFVPTPDGRTPEDYITRFNDFKVK